MKSVANKVCTPELNSHSYERTYYASRYQTEKQRDKLYCWTRPSRNSDIWFRKILAVYNINYYLIVNILEIVITAKKEQFYMETDKPHYPKCIFLLHVPRNTFQVNLPHVLPKGRDEVDQIIIAFFFFFFGKWAQHL